MAKIKAGDKFTNYTVDSVYGTDIIRGYNYRKNYGRQAYYVLVPEIYRLPAMQT